MLDTTERFLVKYRDQLMDEEVATTEAHMQLLKDAITAQDKDSIQHQTEQLNEVSRPYAERVMEGALKDAMKGKKVI
jgi:molecular chaperone HscA